MRFTKWMAVFLLTYLGLEAVFLGIVAVVLSVSISKVLLPGVFLLVAGSVAALLFFWARQSRIYGKPGASRFAIATFVYSILFMSALLASAVYEGILPAHQALTDYTPYVVIASVVGSFSVYVTVKRKGVA